MLETPVEEIEVFDAEEINVGLSDEPSQYVVPESENVIEAN